MCIFCERAQSQLADGLTSVQKRQVEQCERLRERRVRATILTGFLGAGKTTFLNFVLKSLGHGQRIAVVQNEFGSVSVDDQLMPVERSDTEVVVMPNGCLCCRVRGDLVDALRRLAEKHMAEAASPAAAAEQPTANLDGLLIECSGLSEVLPVAQTFFADPYVQASYQLDGVVCVCDAGNFEALEAGGREEGGAAGPEVGRLLREQLALSDVCLLNKCDLIDSGKRDRLTSRVRAVNPAIKVVPCRQGKVNLGQVLKINSFSVESALSLDAHFLDSREGHAAAGHGQDHNHGHDHGHEGGDREHAHASFGSLGLEMHEPVDLEAFKAWLRSVIERHGDALIRIKGVLLTAGTQARTIVQGVGGHVEVNEEAPPADGAAPPRASSRSSRLVLIGRLQGFELAAELRRGFLATAAGARAAADPAAALAESAEAAAARM